MPPLGPLVFLRSWHDSAGGIVPPSLLVQAAAEAGYRTAALVDSGTLAGIPSFLRACRECSLLGMAGMTVRIQPPIKKESPGAEDIFDWGSSLLEGEKHCPSEEVVLLAANRSGFGQLLNLREILGGREDACLDPGDLLAHAQDLFLFVGVPGGKIREWVEGHPVPEEISWLAPLLAGWPKERLAYAGFDLGEKGEAFSRQVALLAKLPGSPHPAAAVWAAYRNESERFWGLAAAFSHASGAISLSGLPPHILLEEKVSRAYQGIASAFRLVEKTLSKSDLLFPSSSVSPPTYQTPRGTDIASFFWTLGQEAAIATGHIRSPGAKDRLVEEFQFLKQTSWPLIWIVLWDLRRRMGLPPGTLRPSSKWIGTSLFAHLLGFCRIDPHREGISFCPEPLFLRHGESVLVEVECPLGWEQETEQALGRLFGENHFGRIGAHVNLEQEVLSNAGNQLLGRWEEMGFPGDRPRMAPPLPLFLERFLLSSRKEEGAAFLLSASAIAQFAARRAPGATSFDLTEEGGQTLGGLILKFVPSPAQTLIAAPCYRSCAPKREKAEAGPETLTNWIERHTGLEFQNRGYADDSGSFEVLGASSSLFRLFTLPSSLGYRPLLWWWIQQAPPTHLGELADLLALAWHGSYWISRPGWKQEACSRAHPLRRENGPPPWWEEWETFAAAAALDSKRAGLFSASLEKVTQGTGGWLLYREQMDRVLEESFQLGSEERDLWLSPEAEGVSKPSDPVWAWQTRAAFQTFLGNPNPLPSRMEFLWRAECLLGCADAYAEDPTAVVAALSVFFPEETEERRELYSILRGHGVQLGLPLLGASCAYDRSPSRDRLRIGTLNIHGVGPLIAAELESALGDSGSDGFLIRNLYAGADLKPPREWQGWLRACSPTLVGWPLLVQLVKLGVFDCFGKSRRDLLIEARRYWRISSPAKGTAQETLFAVSSSIPHRPPSREDQRQEAPSPGHLLEERALHFSVSQSPLWALKDRLPCAWFLPDAGNKRPGSLIHGWVHEVDLFRGLEAGDGGEVSGWCTFLVFTENSVSRIVDTNGLLLSSLPGFQRRELRIEGERFHLRKPWLLLCEVRSLPSPERQETPRYSLIRCQDLEELARTDPQGGSIQVVLTDAPGGLAEDLERWIRWFEGGEASIPLQIESSAGIFKRNQVKRLAGRLGSRRVIPSKILLEWLSTLPGVASVRYQPESQAWFDADQGVPSQNGRHRVKSKLD